MVRFHSLEGTECNFSRSSRAADGTMGVWMTKTASSITTCAAYCALLTTSYSWPTTRVGTRLFAIAALPNCPKPFDPQQ